MSNEHEFDRRTFLKGLIATATLISLPPVPWERVNPKHDQLRPAYQKVMDSKASFVCMTELKRKILDNPEELPTIELRFVKIELSAHPDMRYREILALQDKHPYISEDWNAARDAAWKAHNDAELKELRRIFFEEQGFLPRLILPDADIAA